MEDNKTTIGMQFEDNNDGQKEEPKDLTPAKVEDKPSIPRRVWNTMTKPFRWGWAKVKESPAGAAIGMVTGAAIGVGGKMAYDHFRGKSGGGFIPADPIEVSDETMEYTSSGSSYESTEE